MCKGPNKIYKDDDYKDNNSDDEWNQNDLSDDEALNDLNNTDIRTSLTIRKTGNVPISNSSRPKKSEEQIRYEFMRMF
jgi:hypothetical protein